MLKAPLIICLLISLSSYSQITKQNSLLVELVRNDFLIHVDSSVKDPISQSFIESGDIFAPEINKYVHIDAEELAEGSFDFFKPGLTEIMLKRGFEISFSTTENFENSHEVLINNEKIVLFDNKHLDDYTFWDVAPRRFFRKINQLLEKAESDERFYLLYGGNELGAILLTEKQMEIIEKINQGNSNEIPYKP